MNHPTTVMAFVLEHKRLALASIFALLSTVVLVQWGFPTWLLLLAFCLLLLAVGLLWLSVTTIGQDEEVSIEEALDLAAPTRDEERKVAVLRGIKDLEYERGLGKVSEQDYEQLMQRYRREAKGLLQRLDTSEASVRQKAIDLVDQRLAKVATDSAPKGSNA
jgi:hypothetical protein